MAQDDCQIRFRRADSDVGLDFKHVSPFTEKRHLHLTMGSGVGWIDFDNDDWPDLYCCQGIPWTGAIHADGPEDLLYINRRGVFEDAAVAFDSGKSVYSTGVTAADFNNDGFTDLYVAGFLSGRLYLNLGDGTFRRIKPVENLSADHYGTSAAWGDIDGDGDLDLYIATYLQISPDDYPICKRSFEGQSIHIVCPPRNRRATYDLVLRNDGNGQFSDISAKSGIQSSVASPGLGVVVADLDADHDLDIFVANDAVPNHLWVNDGGGNFVESGLLSGTALNRGGLREAGMGVALGDYDANGSLDILVTNYFNETNTFYRNEGSLFFLDVTDEIGLAAPSIPRLAFGANLTDFDNDGWLDLFVANGHVHDRLNLLGRNTEPFAQNPQLFGNVKGTRFYDASDYSGAYFRSPVVARSSAVADYDRDGRPDIAVQHLNSQIALLQNTSPVKGQSLHLKLIGTDSDRSAVGATVVAEAGGKKYIRSCTANSSYMATDEAVVTVGVSGSGPHQVSATWLNGQRESWAVKVVAGEVIRLRQGTGGR